MVKKKSATDKIIGSLTSASFLSVIKTKIDHGMNQIEKKIEETRKQIIRNVTASFLAAVGLIFLIYGLGLYLQFIGGMVPGVSFVLIGFFAIIIALVVKYVKIGR